MEAMRTSGGQGGYKYYIGLGLSLLSSFLSGASFPVKKRGLQRVAFKRYSGYFASHAYLTDRMWWFGTILMFLGELSHFSAFYFTPATVVTTLQILTVLMAGMISSKILGEKVNRFGKLAFTVCVAGCSLVVFYGPSEQQQVSSADQLFEMMKDGGFVCYILTIIIVTFLVTCVCIPSYGESSSLGYTFVSAICGSFIMISSKALGLAVEGLFNKNFLPLKHWLTWVSLLTVVLALTIQMEYFNKALDLFNTLAVSTQFYVIYSALVILTSTLLFKELQTLSIANLLIDICGFLNIIWGVLLFGIFKEEDPASDLRSWLTGT